MDSKFRILLIMAFAFSPVVMAQSPWFIAPVEKIYTETKCKPSNFAPMQKVFYLLHTENVYAIWCERKSDKKYNRWHLIVVTKDDRHPWAQCPGFITVRQKHQYPLAVDKPVRLYHDKVSMLGKFWRVDSKNRSARQFGPVDVQADGPGLFFGDGQRSFTAGNVFYCYQGAWYMAGFH
ncbi:MAG: hypothetical protein OEY00_05980 [Gammaproteobacteria bacterium]|nr:hypothetical protein [Gammaproteobacteria bacterium]